MMYNNNVKKNLLIFFFIAVMVATPLLSFALGETCDPRGGKICNPLGSSNMTVQGLLLKVLKGALRLGIPIVALAIIYSGFLFVAARGNSEKLGKAKDALLYSVLGGAILLGAIAIAELIFETVKGLAS
jgi:hypothetical protein